MSAAQLEGILERIAQMQSGWNELTELATMRADLDALYLGFDGVANCQLATACANGVDVDTVSAPGAHDHKVIVLFHGGGFSMGSARSHRHLAQWLSSIAACTVVLPDYRLVPEHIYPAQLDDASRVYDWLLDQGHYPDEIAIAGDSAGGGLSLALIAHLQNSGRPLPACACLMSPWLDLQCKGESYRTLTDQDPVATHDMALGMGQAYVGDDGCLTDPLASPILLDFDGFPPLMIQSGGREIFLDDARTVADCAQKAGVTVEFSEWPEMIHQWHLYAGVLEDARRAIHAQAEFLARYLRVR
ncbi:MAG: alpha/beta hydrolase [Pseudomonadota bacterium]